jgi:hypothetical protein
MYALTMDCKDLHEIAKFYVALLQWENEILLHITKLYALRRPVPHVVASLPHSFGNRPHSCMTFIVQTTRFVSFLPGLVVKKYLHFFSLYFYRV